MGVLPVTLRTADLTTAEANAMGITSKLNSYTTVEAQGRLKKGKRAGWGDLLVRPPQRFLNNFLRKGGWRIHPGEITIIIDPAIPTAGIPPEKPTRPSRTTPSTARRTCPIPRFP